MFSDLTQKPQKAVKYPKIMGILNVTPDSFSDGGKFSTLDLAIERAKQMLADGVDIIDIGGESTRPGALEVDVDEEIRRTIPVIEALRAFSDIEISIDTSKAEVMQAAVNAGATMINDVRALQLPNSLTTAKQFQVPVCLMHMQGNPKTMQNKPRYDDVIDEVKSFLRHRIFDCQSAGIEQKNIIIDPGFGFGKTVDQNFEMLNRLEEFQSLNAQILVGISRKSMLGAVNDMPVDKRLPESLASAIIAVLKGANIIRVHDVLETKQALAIVNKVNI